MILTIILLVATVYSGPYVGQPLYCDRGEGLIYDEAAAPWVALPVSEHGITWECGDLVYVGGVDANGEPWSLLARALDAGPLAGYCVEMPAEEGAMTAPLQCVPIGVDVPAPFAPFAGTSARVDRFVNFTAEAQGR